MKTLEFYIFRMLAIAAAAVTVVLTVIVFLTQSLKIIELIMESGAAASTFWLLTALSLPRFFEVILPLAILAAVLFVYSRMAGDSEIVAGRSAGFSPRQLAHPALVLGATLTIFLLFLSFWAAPKALASMHLLRQEVRSQISVLLFREGVFNQAGKGLTVYIRQRAAEGELQGLMIHDHRDEQRSPSVVLAKRGALVANDKGHEVVVYDGVRQEYDPQTEKLQSLDFDRYTIEIPESTPPRDRWREPEERTIFELMTPDPNDVRSTESLRDFRAEIHRRISAPFLAVVFALLGCTFMLTGAHERRGPGRRLMVCVILAAVVQGLSLASYSLARQSDAAFILMYAVIAVPLLLSWITLTGHTYKIVRIERRESLR